MAIVVLAEDPYSEGAGDRGDLPLPAADLALLARVRPLADRLVVVLLSGRPLVVTEQLAEWDAFVAAWLPGSEGAGVADVLFGQDPVHRPAALHVAALERPAADRPQRRARPTDAPARSSLGATPRPAANRWTSRPAPDDPILSR